MAASLTFEAAGPATLRPISIWPAITADEAKGLRPTLESKVELNAEIGLPFESNGDRSTLWVPEPFSPVDGQPESTLLLAFAAVVAQQLQRKQLRYGLRGLNLLVGFSEHLPAEEQAVCDDNRLVGRDGRKSFPGGVMNDDGSVTYTYRADLYKLKPFDLLRARVMNEIAPRLHGVVVCNATVNLTNAATESMSLFASPGV